MEMTRAWRPQRIQMMEYVQGGSESIFVCLYSYIKARVVLNVEQTVAQTVMRRAERGLLIPQC